jgi:hypothetical protein
MGKDQTGLGSSMLRLAQNEVPVMNGPTRVRRLPRRSSGLDYRMVSRHEHRAALGSSSGATRSSAWRSALEAILRGDRKTLQHPLGCHRMAHQPTRRATSAPGSRRRRSVTYGADQEAPGVRPSGVTETPAPSPRRTQVRASSMAAS